MSAAARLLVIGALAAAAVLAGCGEDDDLASTAATTSSPAELTSSDRDLLADSEAVIVEYCRRRALGLTDPDKRPTAAQQARALEAVDAMIGLARERPESEVMPGVEVSLFLGDLTENLQGSNCDPQIVARLDAGLASLP